MSWEIRKKLREQLSRESGYYVYSAGSRISFGLAYPNSYFVGMSNLGLHIIYKILNQRNDTACERFFLPDKDIRQRYTKTHTPLLSMETQRGMLDFDIIGFVLSFEMDYFNVLEMLEIGKIKALVKERGEQEPILIAGGPCATFNPEPLGDFFDAFIIGEGEVIMPAFMEAYKKAKELGEDRKALLKRLSLVPGVYVSSLRNRASRQWVRNLDEYSGETAIFTENTEFNLHLVEVARGCGRHCRFCMAGYSFRNPRARSLESIKKMLVEAKKTGRRVGLMGAAVSDYPEIDALCKDILGAGLSMSVASFRADSVTLELMNSLAKSGLRTITMAPEAGSSRMRTIINKGIEEEHLFNAMNLAIKAGIKNFRLYIMIGLPYEKQEDIEAIVALAHRLKDFMEEKGAMGRLTLSINPFIPKPFTPFQWVPMAPIKYIQGALKRITNGLRKRHNVEVIAESPKEAYIQGVLARGDRRLAKALYLAHKKGGMKAFKQAMKECSLNMDDYLYRQREKDEAFPWDCMDLGFSREYLYKELENAKNMQVTPKCFAGCKRCGVCD